MIIHELSNQPEGITFGDLWRAISPTNTMSMQTFSDNLKALTQMEVLLKNPSEPRRGEKVVYKLSPGMNEFAFLSYRGVIELVRLLKSTKLISSELTKSKDPKDIIFAVHWCLQYYANLSHKTMNRYLRDSFRLSCYVAKYPKARGFFESITKPYLEILLTIHSALLRKLGTHNIDDYLDDLEREDLQFPAFPYEYSEVITKTRRSIRREPRKFSKAMQDIERELNEFGRDIVKSVLKLHEISPDPLKIYRELRRQVEELEASPTVAELFGTE